MTAMLQFIEGDFDVALYSPKCIYAALVGIVRVRPILNRSSVMKRRIYS